LGRSSTGQEGRGSNALNRGNNHFVLQEIFYSGEKPGVYQKKSDCDIRCDSTRQIGYAVKKETQSRKGGAARSMGVEEAGEPDGR